MYPSKHGCGLHKIDMAVESTRDGILLGANDLVARCKVTIDVVLLEI